MENLGQKEVYLTGSRKTVKRNVYLINGFTYIKWRDIGGGTLMVEVSQRDGLNEPTQGWKTKLEY